jgi:hypothetical protein
MAPRAKYAKNPDIKAPVANNAFPNPENAVLAEVVN